MRVCLGGTFHPFHRGHKALLRIAVEAAGSTGSVFIGVTDDDIAKQKGITASFEKRKHDLQRFLKDLHALNQVTIQPLHDRYGPAVTGAFDVIIVSPETQPTAEEINKKRRESGRTPLQIICVPFVLAEDQQPISSSRIRNKEIDEDGRLL
ncbi:MAG: pantetheine-phosphate adenylyltransferase [Candidatus Thermoplasmatota archaeon]|nr:pantetheine-phosphate adenylyltransferase [Candidatus Thermoplasmatota archaeon]